MRANHTGRRDRLGLVSRVHLLPLAAIASMMFVAQPVLSAHPGFELHATAADFQTYFPGYLANGYFSTATSPRGTEATPSYVVALMDYGTDDVSRPAAAPGWTGVDYSTGTLSAGHFWMNQVPLNADIFQDYRQTLDLHDATLTTAYRYIDHERTTQVQVTTFVDQADPHIAVQRFSITPDFDGIVELSFALTPWVPSQPRLPLGRLTGDEMQDAVAANHQSLTAIAPATPDRAPIWYRGDVRPLAADGDTGAMTLAFDGRAERGLAMAEAMAVHVPEGAEIVSRDVHRSPYRLSLDIRVKVAKGHSYDFDKFVALSRKDWGGDAQADVALARTAREAGFDSLIAAHRAAWADLWKSDIRIEGDPKAQLAVHSDLYYLLASTTPNTAWAVGACSLTPGYLGHIFWDSDSWVFPALLLLHPERAKSLVEFRARTLPAAQARARADGLLGAKYPWESDPETGTEQIPHFAGVLSEREIHVNADVALAQWQYWLATQDQAWLVRDGWPVIRNLADFWMSRASWNAKLKRYEIAHVTSVAESYADVPNDTFTNASAQKVLQIATQLARQAGDKPNPRWAEIAAKLYIPFSPAEQRHYDFDPIVPRPPLEGSTITMLTYPSLDYPMPAIVRRNDFIHAMGTTNDSHHEPNGMGLAPASIAAATVGDDRRAAEWLQREVTGAMIKAPFNVRTETPTNNTAPFITASGGFIQSLVYGVTGLRIEPAGLVPAYQPVLPASWGAVTFQNLHFRGQMFDVAVRRDAKGKPIVVRTPPAHE